MQHIVVATTVIVVAALTTLMSSTSCMGWVRSPGGAVNPLFLCWKIKIVSRTCKHCPFLIVFSFFFWYILPRYQRKLEPWNWFWSMHKKLFDELWSLQLEIWILVFISPKLLLFDNALGIRFYKANTALDRQTETQAGKRVQSRQTIPRVQLKVLISKFASTFDLFPSRVIAKIKEFF